MRNFYVLRAPEGDGSTSGSGQTPSAPTQTTETAPSAPAESSTTIKDVWSGRAAPDWTKTAGISKVHDKTNVGKEIPDENAPAVVTPPPAAKPVITRQPIQPATPPVAAPAAQPASPPAIDYKQFASAVRDAIQPTTQPAQQVGLSDEQIAQQLGIFKADEASYESVFGVKPTPQQLEAYNRHLQGVAKQAVTISSVISQRQLEEINSRLAPVLAAQHAQRVESLKNEFYTSHSDLKGYEPIVEAVYYTLKSSGVTYPTPSDAMKALADETRARLKKAGITPAAQSSTPPSTTTPTTTPPQTASRKMTTTFVGGRTGGSPALKTKDMMQAVWGQKT